MPELAVGRMATGRDDIASAGSVLIIDHAVAIRESLQTLLEFEGYSWRWRAMARKAGSHCGTSLRPSAIGFRPARTQWC